MWTKLKNEEGIKEEDYRDRVWKNNYENKNKKTWVKNVSFLNGDHEIHYWSKGDLVKRMDNLELNLTTLKLKIKKKEKKEKKDRVCIDMKEDKISNKWNPKTSCFRPIHHTQLLKKSLNPLIWWNIISLHFCKRKW